jgi:hypothetical protein
MGILATHPAVFVREATKKISRGNVPVKRYDQLEELSSASNRFDRVPDMNGASGAKGVSVEVGDREQGSGEGGNWEIGEKVQGAGRDRRPGFPGNVH